jgi:sugar phosphate isomerase/epimerase
MELALTPDSRWKAELPELVRAAHDAGFAAMGISGDRATGDALATYRASDLRCHEILALVLGDDEESTLASAEGLAHAAATMGASWVLTVFRAPLTSATAQTIRRCAALFSEAGAAMAVEFSPFGPAKSISAGLEIVDIAGPGHAGLMIDSWHFSFGESSWEELETVPLDKIAYVQFSDASKPESDDLMHETMDRRLLPGAGVLELDRFASTLRGRGWDGLVSLELLSSELSALPPEEFALRAFESSVGYWR